MPKLSLSLIAQTHLIEALQQILTKTQVEAIRASLYFDVFHYPLTPAELFANSAVKVSEKEFEAALSSLLDAGFLQRSGDFILSPFATVADIKKRLDGNRGAREAMPLAHAYSRRIASFPFVEGLCLSGALSKNYYDDKGDIDYFIITRPGRLWICRSLLIARFKLMPEHKRKYWCVNYFVSSDSLELPDRNAFTATELAHLIPVVNDELYKELLSRNAWYRSQFPNKKALPTETCIDAPRPFFRKLLEGLLSGALGRRLDNALLKATLKRWRKKYPELSEEDFELQFRSRKNVCKRHTHGFQNKVLARWEENMKKWEQQFNTGLGH